MKKTLTIAAFAGMLAIVACGPSAEDQAAKEKAKQDSIANAEKAKTDSMAAAAAADQPKMDAATDSTATAPAAGEEKK